MDSYFSVDRPFILHIASSDSYFPVHVEEEALQIDYNDSPFANPDDPKFDVRPASAWPRHFPEVRINLQLRRNRRLADLT